MKNKIKRFFTSNIGWKIVSLLIGLAIWITLSNMQDPLVTKTLNIPVTYINEDMLLKDEKLYVLSKPETVSISVRVPKSKQTKAVASLFTCTADLIDHNGSDLANQRVYISVTQIEGNDIVEDWSYLRGDPNITVSMDEYISKTFNVTLLTDGTLAADAQFQGPVEFNPAEITVSGPKSRFANVNSVKATVNLEELNTMGPGLVTVDDIPVRLYDANDEVIRNLDEVLVISSETVSLNATIARLREVQVTTEGASGTPADGFRYDYMTVEPNTVVVKGLKGNLSELNSVTIPADAINIEGISENREYEIDLSKYLPEGVSIADTSTAVVTVYVEQIASETKYYDPRRIQILNTDDRYLYTLQADAVPVQVRGYQEDLDVLDINASLQAYIDATGLEPAYTPYELPLVLDPLSGYTIENQSLLTVRMSVRYNEDIMTTEEETETETERTRTETSSEDEETTESSTSESESESTSEETEPQESESVESETEPESEVNESGTEETDSAAEEAVP